MISVLEGRNTDNLGEQSLCLDTTSIKLSPG